jgi:hypothetical protein
MAALVPKPAPRPTTASTMARIIISVPFYSGRKVALKTIAITSLVLLSTYLKYELNVIKNKIWISPKR